MAEPRAGCYQRKMCVLQKTDAILEKEMQLKFLKELFPGVNPMTLHDALCEVNFDADEAAKTLMGMSRKVSETLPFAQWKNEVNSMISSSSKCEEKSLPNSSMNKRSSTSNTTNDTKRAKLEKLFTEKKSTKLQTSDEVIKTPVQQKSNTAHMTLNFIPRHEKIRNEKRDSLESKISYVEEGSGSETKLPRNETLVKSEDNPKQLRSSGPAEFNIMDFIVKRKTSKLSEKIRKRVNVSKIEETSSDSTCSFNVLNSPNCSSIQTQTVTSYSNYNSYDGNDPENDRNVLLNIFQTAGINDLNFITSFSKRAADAIIECRPYKSWIDLIQKLQDNKFLDIDVLNTTRQLLDIYKNLKILISKLEVISKTVKKEIVLGTINQQPLLVSPSVRLMEHQILGLNWLVSMKEQKINGILMDDDQFSTSVQVISFLAYLKETKATKEGIPHLVVVPSWKKDDWRSDFRRISPELKVFYYHGSKEERRQYRNEWYKGDISKYDVILAIQGSFLSTPEEIKMFRIMQLHCVVFDETVALHDITNVYNEHVMKIKASQKLLLLSKPPQVNVLEVISLLKFVFPTDFHISPEDLTTFINNKYLIQKNDLSSFHLEIVELAVSILKKVSFQRLNNETLIFNVPSSTSFKKDTNNYSLPAIINDQIESIIKEIQRLDLPIKLTFSQLTTSPQVFLRKLNLVDEMTRIKESVWKRESRVPIRGGRGGRGRRGLGMWSRARGRRSYASHWRHHNRDSSSAECTGGSSNESSTESCSISIDFSNDKNEIFNLDKGSTKVIQNVARRGRKLSGAVCTSDSSKQRIMVPSSPNIARRGRRFSGSSQISRISVEGIKNDNESSTRISRSGKNRGRGRSKRQQTVRDVSKVMTTHKTVQTTPTATRKILEVKPIIMQTTGTKNVNKESDSDDEDTFIDSDFEESNSSPSSSDTDESWKGKKGKKGKQLRRNRRNKRNTRSYVERRSKSVDYHSENMLRDIWNEKNKSQDSCEENSDEVSVDKVKIEFDEEAITVKEEPLEKKIKVEVGEDSKPQPSTEPSPNKQQTPPILQENPLFIEEENRDETTERATQFNVVNIFNKDVILNADDIARNNNQNTTASPPANKLTEQNNKKIEKNTCIDLTSDKNDVIIISDDSEVEEQLNKKISFNEVLADIDEQGIASFKTKDNGKNNNKSKKIKEESDKVATSKDSEIIDKSLDFRNVQPLMETMDETNVSAMSVNIPSEPGHSNKSLDFRNVQPLIETTDETNVSAMSVNIPSEPGHSDNCGKSDRTDELSMEVTSVTANVNESSKEANNSLQLEEIMMIIFGDEMSDSPVTDAENCQLSQFEIITENISEGVVPGNSHQAEQQSRKVPSILRKVRNKSSSSTRETKIVDKLSSSRKENKLLNDSRNPQPEKQKSSKMSTCSHPSEQGSRKVPSILRKAENKSASSTRESKIVNKLSSSKKDNKLLNDSRNPRPEKQKSSKMSTFSHPSEQGSSKVSSFLNKTKNKSSSSTTDSELVKHLLSSKTDNKLLKDSRNPRPEKEKFSKMSTFSHPAEQGSNKVPSFLNKAKNKSSSFTEGSEIVEELSSSEKDNKLLKESKNPHPEEEKSSKMSTFSRPAEQGSNKVSSFLNKAKNESSSFTVYQIKMPPLIKIKSPSSKIDSKVAKELSSGEKDDHLLKDSAPIGKSNVEIEPLPGERDLSSDKISTQSTKTLSLQQPNSTCLKTESLSGGMDTEKRKHSSSIEGDIDLAKELPLENQFSKKSDSLILKDSDTNNMKSNDESQSPVTSKTEKNTSANVLSDVQVCGETETDKEL